MGCWLKLINLWSVKLFGYWCCITCLRVLQICCRLLGLLSRLLKILLGDCGLRKRLGMWWRTGYVPCVFESLLHWRIYLNWDLFRTYFKINYFRIFYLNIDKISYYWTSFINTNNFLDFTSCLHYYQFWYFHHFYHSFSLLLVTF